jgi:hypothetical protein
MVLQHLDSQKPIYKKSKEENNLIDLNKVDPSKIMKNDISNNNISPMLRINTNVELRANQKRSIYN